MFCLRVWDPALEVGSSMNQVRLSSFSDRVPACACAHVRAPICRSRGDLAPGFIWIRHLLHGDRGGVESVASIVDEIVGCSMVSDGLKDRQPQRMPEVEVPTVPPELRRGEAVVPDRVQGDVPVVEGSRVLHLEHGTVPAELRQHGRGCRQQPQGHILLYSPLEP